ncbi:MBL fold metallo-hydrolase [Paenibacillus terreus]|uniref:MBL fold metallo-hydrolase n=1 Tax=Paenibacillus terreus TaxID=1387834 RepID=A0ABV5B4T5_9BACL
MQISTKVKILEVPFDSAFGPSTIHPALLKDDDGLTLVDTGMITQFDRLRDAVAAAGEDFNSIKRVIITHQDIDHIGNMGAIADLLPDTAFLAHEADIPYITGDKPFLKLSPERISQMEGVMREETDAFLRRLPDFRFAHVLEDGETLPYGGGIQIIHTPGHTPGHISIYVPGDRLLLAGDAMRVVNSELLGPAEHVTPDMAQALASLDRLVDLDIGQIVCYHGGLYKSDGISERISTLSGIRA